MLDGHSAPSGMLRRCAQPERTKTMRTVRSTRGKASLFAAYGAAALCVAWALCVHVWGASLPGSAAEDAMIPKIETIFAPLSDARSPGVAVLVRRGGRTIFEHGYGVRDLRSLAAIDPET